MDFRLRELRRDKVEIGRRFALVDRGPWTSGFENYAGTRWARLRSKSFDGHAVDVRCEFEDQYGFYIFATVQ